MDKIEEPAKKQRNYLNERWQPPTLNDRLKELRDSLELSQRQMAEFLEVRQSFLSDIENGRRALSNKFLEKLVSKTNVSKDWMYTGKGNMFTENKGSLNYPFAVPLNVPPENEHKNNDEPKGNENQTVSEIELLLLDKIISDNIQSISFYCVDLLGRISLTEDKGVNTKQIAKYVENLEAYVRNIKMSGMFEEPDYKAYTVTEKIIFLSQICEKLKKCLDDLWILGSSGKWVWNDDGNS